MGDGGDLLSIDGQTGLGANSVSAIRNLGETAMTATREAALEAALKGMIYATTSLSQEQDDGSHWCKIRREVLAQARAAISTPATEPQGYVEGLEAVLEIVADGHSKDYTDNCILARQAIAARPAPQPAADTPAPMYVGIDLAAKGGDETVVVIHNPTAAMLDAIRSADQPAADTRVGDGPKGGVRFAVPAGDTKEQMRNWLTNTKEGQSLYNTGDCLLVWANEGDLFQPPATPAPSDKIAEAARKSLRDALAYIDKGHHGMARNILAAAIRSRGVAG